MPGWRLPTIDELRTLTYCSSGRPTRFSSGQTCEGEHQQPTIEPEAFPYTPSSIFWSGSPFAGSSNYAWFVYFGKGYTDYNYRSGSNRVRLVRGGR